MSTSTLTVRMDSQLKDQAGAVLESMGQTFTSAITALMNAIVNRRRLPFIVEAPDPYYSEAHLARLAQARDRIASGDGIVFKSMDELEAMANA